MYFALQSSPFTYIVTFAKCPPLSPLKATFPDLRAHKNVTMESSQLKIVLKL